MYKVVINEGPGIEVSRLSQVIKEVAEAKGGDRVAIFTCKDSLHGRWLLEDSYIKDFE